MLYCDWAIKDAAIPVDEKAEAEAKEKEKLAREVTDLKNIEEIKEKVSATGSEDTDTTRRRKGIEKKDKAAGTIEEETKEKSEEVKEESKPETVRKPRIPLNMDPIRWFGILVPQQLRMSQRCFNEGTIFPLSKKKKSFKFFTDHNNSDRGYCRDVNCDKST